MLPCTLARAKEVSRIFLEPVDFSYDQGFLRAELVRDSERLCEMGKCELIMRELIMWNGAFMDGARSFKEHIES